MPLGPDLDDSEGEDTPKMSFFQRIRYSMVVPDDTPGEAKEQASVEELQAEVTRMSDRERAIGLVAAPLAAIVALLIGANSISYAKAHAQSTSIYSELEFVLLGMSVLILVSAWLRKRLIIGVVMALFGLGVFNLKYWGFGVPFILAGAWYLVRAWRLQQSLKRATGDGPAPRRSSGGTPKPGPRPRQNKRYTPPT
jgi:hypothetical protein